MRKRSTISTLLSVLGILIWGIVSQVSLQSYRDIPTDIRIDKTEWVASTLSNSSDSTIDFASQSDQDVSASFLHLDYADIIYFSENQAKVRSKAASQVLTPTNILRQLAQSRARSEIESPHS